MTVSFPASDDQIAVVNLSQRMRPRDLATIVDACARQLAEDVCPAWGVPYRPVNVYDSISALPPLVTDPLFILDHAADKRVYGSHFRAITPVGRIFMDPIIDEGRGSMIGSTIDPDAFAASRVISHELIEMTVDPDLDLFATDAAGHEWDIEPSDPVEGTQYFKVAEMPWGKIPVAVSDFVLRGYYQPGSSGPWNYVAGRPLAGPFTLAPGRYATKDGDQIFGFRADGSPDYPPPWKLALRIHGRAAFRIASATRPRRQITFATS